MNLSCLKCKAVTYNPMMAQGRQHGTDGQKTSYKRSSVRILIAEDDITVANGYRSILEDAGYQVVEVVYNGADAVQKAIECNPNLIIMDIKMPRMDGLEAARAINSPYKNSFIPIIFVTAFTERHFVEKAKGHGVLGYLVKPVQLDDLVPAIEMAWSTAQTINALEGIVENLSEELEARKLIEKAKGVIMKHMSLDEETAMKMMQKESQRQRIKMKDLARTIVSMHSSRS